MVVVGVRAGGGVVVVRDVGVILGPLPVVVVVGRASVGFAGGTQEALAVEEGQGCGVQEQSSEVPDEERLVRAHGTWSRTDSGRRRGTNSPTCQILFNGPSLDHATTYDLVPCRECGHGHGCYDTYRAASSLSCVGCGL